jgi:hypothetical protein
MRYTPLHTFDQHPQMTEFFAELKRLSRHMKNAGYLSDAKSVLHDMYGRKGFHLCQHSEKLAIAFVYSCGYFTYDTYWVG